MTNRESNGLCARRKAAAKLSALVVTLSVVGLPQTMHAQERQEDGRLLTADANDWLGRSVAVSGDLAAIGEGGFSSGSFYAFRNDADGWTKVCRVSNTNSYGFATDIAIHGSTVVVGDPVDSTQGLDAGAVHVFSIGMAGCAATQKLVGSDARSSDIMGYSVAVTSGRILAGAPYFYEASLNTGKAFLFEEQAGQWVETARLSPSDANPSDHFGWDVALSGAHALVGSYRNDEGGADAGAAYLYDLSGESPMLMQKLIGGQSGDADYFGWSVALYEGLAVVGAPGVSSAHEEQGAVYVFEYVSGSWQEVDRLLSPEASPGQRFGYSVAASSGGIVIGINPTDSVQGPESGRAYHYVRQGADWTLSSILVASDAASGDSFGDFVALDGSIAIVSAWLKDVTSRSGPEGAAYSYNLIAPTIFSDGFEAPLGKAIVEAPRW